MTNASIAKACNPSCVSSRLTYGQLLWIVGTSVSRQKLEPYVINLVSISLPIIVSDLAQDVD